MYYIRKLLGLRETPPSSDQVVSGTCNLSSHNIASGSSASHKTVFTQDTSHRKRTISYKASLIILVFSIITVFLTTIPSIAATNAKTKTGGVTISPAFQELSVRKDFDQVPAKFSISNNDTTPAIFKLSAIDMGTLDETGGVAFTGLTADYQTKYGLAKWIKLEHGEVTVPPKTSANINFEIVDDGTLSPGGHYGAIIAKRQGDQANDSNQISLSPEVTSLLFVKKINGARYAMELKSHQTDGSAWKLPQKVKLNFSNSGNVHIVPRGTVTVSDRLGRVISRGIINDNSSMILPERTRQLTTRLTPLSRAYLPGRYKIELAYRYDGQDSPMIISNNVYWLNLPILSGIFIAITGVYYGSYRLWRILQKRRVQKPKPQPTKKTKKSRSINIIYKP